MTTAAVTPAPVPAAWRGRAVDAAVLVVAWSFAIAQPLLDLFGRNPEFFVAHSATSFDVVAFGIGLAIVVPIVGAAIVVGIGMLSAPVGRIVHRAVLALLVAELALQIVKQTALPEAFQLAIPVVVGVGAALLYDRRADLRHFTWWLAPAPAFFLVLFLAGPVNGLVFTHDVDVTSSSGVRVTDPAPVVLVVFDELPVVSLMAPDGTLDRADFPNFARLADRSTWYRNTTADWPSTGESVPTILTGRIDTGSVATASENPKSIFTLLGGGYDVDAFEAVTKLCPDSLCGSGGEGIATTSRVRQLLDDTRVVAGHVLLPDALGSSLPAVDRSWGDFGDRSTSVDETHDSAAADSGAGVRKQLAALDPTGATRQFTAGLVPHDRPTLSVLHVEIPHVPWRFLPTGRQYPDAETLPGVSDEVWSNDPQLPRFGRARHLLQTRWADHLLGEILDRLDRGGIGRRATVVVTADHGVAFQPGAPRREPTAETLGDIAYVPLFVGVPGRPAAVDDRPARLDDIVPTIADALGVRAPGWKWDGRSLLAASPPASRPRSIRAFDGTVFTIGPGTSTRDDALARRWATFPTHAADPDPGGVFATGRLAGDVGRPEPAATALPGASVVLDQQQALADADPAGSLVPTLLTGRIDGVPDGRDLEVGIDGTVAGVGRTYGDGRFTALVSPTALRKGANRVSVLLADDGGFRSVAVAGPAAWRTLRAPDGTRVLESSDGTRVTVAPDQFDGYADVDRAPGVVTLNGWAATKPPGPDPLTILVFRNDRFLASTTTGTARPDVARVLNDPALGTSGFALKFPPSGIGAARHDVVSVYAVSDGRASELRYTAQYGYEQPPLADARLTHASGRDEIHTTDGRTIAVGPAGLRGAVSTNASGISGWVARGEQPYAGWLVAFVDGRVAWVGSSGAAKTPADAPTGSGFEAPVPDATRARVFAVVGDTAQELRPGG